VTEKVRQPDGSLSERTVEYEYDELYRLIEAAVWGGETIIYSYDEVGNRISAGARSYVYDDNDRLIEEREGGEVVVEYSYDDNGNLLSRTEGNETVDYIWDDRNRLIAVEENGERVEFEYDDDNIRVSQTVGSQKTSFLLDKNRPYDQVLAEFVDGEEVASYVYGLDLISQERNGEDWFYFVDGLGSTRGLTDSSGGVTDAYWYDAYGNLLEHEGDSENDYLFAGEQFDEALEQYYLRQRYYDATTGRFTRRDTYEGRLEEPITLHKYLYGNGNPVNYTDPSGLFSVGEVIAGLSILSVLINAQQAIHHSINAFHATTPEESNQEISLAALNTLGVFLGLFGGGFIGPSSGAAISGSGAVVPAVVTRARYITGSIAIPIAQQVLSISIGTSSSGIPIYIKDDHVNKPKHCLDDLAPTWPEQRQKLIDAVASVASSFVGTGKKNPVGEVIEFTTGIPDTSGKLITTTISYFHKNNGNIEINTAYVPYQECSHPIP